MGNATSWLAQSFCPEEQVLWIAAKSGDHETIAAALTRLTPETRAYLEWADPLYRYTPLATASANGHAQCVLALLDAGVDPNARDVSGNTPLLLAARYGKSEVVRVLLDHPGVDVFARNTTKGMGALEFARYGYKSEEHQSHNFIKCVELIEVKLCIYAGWLYQRTDTILSLASGFSSLNGWKKRYCTVLRTPDRSVVELDFFPIRPGEKRPPCPTLELIYRAADGIQESSDITWLQRREFRFALHGYTKSGINRVSAPQTFEFAAMNQAELVAWKSFLVSLRVNTSSMPTISTAFTPSASVGSSSLQEQRDLERALRLSSEEARRTTSSSQFAPPAIQVPPPRPSAPVYSESISPRATIAPDGVEIVQQIPMSPDAVAHRTPISEEERHAIGTGECVICFDGPQSAVCVPCGHNAICMDCAKEVLDTTALCPVCRMQVREVIKIFRV